jgi:hypothetical protein
MEEARWSALFPGNSIPVLMIGGKCSCFRAKAAQFSGHLPVQPDARHSRLPGSNVTVVVAHLDQETFCHLTLVFVFVTLLLVLEQTYNNCTQG